MYLTILKKGLLLIAVPLLFLFVFIAVLVQVLREASAADSLAMHTKDVLVQVESAYGDLVAAQSGTRGFLISGDTAFSDDALQSIDSSLAGFKALEELTRDNPGQNQRAAAALQSVRELAELIRRVNAAMRTNFTDDATSKSAALEGRRRLEALRVNLNEFVRQETELQTQRLQQVQRSRQAQQWVVGGGILGATLVTCFVAWLFSRSISQRLNVVTANAEALAEGRPLAERLRGSDEIARLDAVVHQSAQRLYNAAESQRRLKGELEKRAAALSAANESLRQQTQENEMFVYSVSHDLRSPLVNLQGFSQELIHASDDLRQILSDERIPPDVHKRVDRVMDGDINDSIRFIQSAVTRSAAIIDALLRLSRAGRIEYRKQQVDVLAIIRRVIDAMANTTETRKAKIKVATDLPPCWGDPTAIEQVFGNLIGNAVNYLDPNRPGEVEIGLSTDSTLHRDGMHTYYVRDNGLGIPAAYLAKVFVAFQRLHGDVAKGEGIGLALVRRVVERHGGEIWVVSEEGVGTTFYLALPTQDPGAARLAEADRRDDNDNASGAVEPTADVEPPVPAAAGSPQEAAAGEE